MCDELAKKNSSSKKDKVRQRYLGELILSNEYILKKEKLSNEERTLKMKYNEQMRVAENHPYRFNLNSNDILGGVLYNLYNKQKYVDRFSGFADCYDKYRPTPPKLLTEILTNYVGKKPSLVVDLGCGTGLSTFLWKGHSDKIIGIDPNEDMLNKAMDKLSNNKEDNNIAFQFGYGNSTNVEANSADIITCSSSFQWMEPESTINEILRILKDGGVYAVYNHDQPNIFDWRLEKAYGDLLYKMYKFLDESTEDEGRGKLWTLKEYMDVMKKTNKFRFMKEIVIHHRVKMDADGFIGFAFSQGALQILSKKKIPWVNEEIQKFIELVKERWGNDEVEAFFSYRIRLAIK